MREGAPLRIRVPPLIADELPSPLLHASVDHCAELLLGCGNGFYYKHAWYVLIFILAAFLPIPKV